MFNNNNETNGDDDDLFAPNTSSSSNLAHLFGGQGDLKTSLTYIPPKQPKVNDNQTLQPQKKLVCVKTISLSKLVETTYSTVGKFGIAIIADQISADLILYKTKQNILSTTKLSSNLSINHFNDSAVTFTDDQTLTWMVTFDSNKDKIDFIAELAKQGVEMKESTSSSSFEETKINLSGVNNNETLGGRLIAEKPEEERTRADILGRMSKLGMSILPGAESSLNTPLPSLSPLPKKLSLKVDKEKELSESEPEEVIRTSKVRKFRGRHSESAIETMDLVPKSPVSPFAANVQHVAYGHQLVDPLNIYFAENRTHNSEIRMNLSQLGNKIDTLLNELRPQSSLQSRSDDRAYFERRIVELERKLEQVSNKPAASQISNAANEELEELNVKLKMQIEENAETVKKCEETISNLQKDTEVLQEKLNIEVQGKETALQELKISNETNEVLTESNKTLELKIAELEKLVENQKLKLNDFAEYTKQNQEDKLDRLAREAAEEELKKRANFLQISLDQSNKKIGELEVLYQQVLESRAKEEDIFADLVKESMNVMYQSVLTDSIDSTTNLDVRDLKKILQKHLKSTTFSIINQYSMRKDHDSNRGGQGMASVSPEFEVTV